MGYEKVYRIWGDSGFMIVSRETSGMDAISFSIVDGARHLGISINTRTFMEFIIDELFSTELFLRSVCLEWSCGRQVQLPVRDAIVKILDKIKEAVAVGAKSTYVAEDDTVVWSEEDVERSRLAARLLDIVIGILNEDKEKLELARRMVKILEEG